MEKEKRNLYADVLLDAYNKSLIKIIWSTSGFSLGIDSKSKDLIPEFKENDFVSYAFSIIKIVVSIAEGKEIKNEPIDIEIAQKIYQKEYDLKNHLYIKKNSTIDSYKMLEYEIISHRNKDNPNIIEADSAVIKMVTERGKNETTYIFEISKRDIRDIIAVLTELSDRIDII